MTILVIEDNRLLRVAIQRTLLKAGHLVIAVGNGQEGLDRAKQDPPDLILLDLMLPGMEGATVLSHLKQDADTKSVPVIVLSGLSQKNEERLKEAGATAYFEKSLLNLDENKFALLHAIERVLHDTQCLNANS